MYVFINRHGRESYFYSAVEPKRKKLSEIIAMMSMIAISLIVVCLMMIFSSYPTKISDGECEASGVYYTDSADLIKDESAFNAAMKSFYEKTGAEPYLFTTTEALFPSSVYGTLSKNSLEEFAYDKYLDLFDDEGHYMICYARANDGTEMWLEMAGTDTTSLLDDEVFESFRQNMSTKLYNSEDKGLAITECLLVMADEAFVRTGSDIFIFVLAIIIAVGGAVAITLGTIQQIKQMHEINDYCDYVEGGKGKANTDTQDGVKINFMDHI